MLNLFKKKDPVVKLQKQYEQLMKKSHELSKIDRTKADQAYAQAEEIAKKIDALKA